MTDTTKDNIIKYCKEDNIPCVDSSSRNPPLVWSLDVNGLTVYAITEFPQRIFIQLQIMFEELEKTINEWDEAKKNNFTIELRTFALLHNINLDLIKDSKGRITGILLYKVYYHSSISKSNFVPLQLRVRNIQEILLFRLGALLGTEVKKLQAQQKTDSSTNPAIM